MTVGATTTVSMVTASSPCKRRTTLMVDRVTMPPRKKQRCWVFRVNGIRGHVDAAHVKSTFREKYRAVKRLALLPVTNRSSYGSKSNDIIKNGNSNSEDFSVSVEVQFIGPQPSEGPAALLRGLLLGTSVDAQPIHLGRGRKKRWIEDIDTCGEPSDGADDECSHATHHGGSPAAPTGVPPLSPSSLSLSSGSCHARVLDDDSMHTDDGGRECCLPPSLPERSSLCDRSQGSSMDLFADNESVAAAADVTRTSLFTSWRAGAELGNDSSERARFSSTPFNQQQHPSPLMLPSTHCTHIEHEGLGNGSIVRAVSTDEAAEQTTSCYERSNDFISSEGGEVTAEPLQNPQECDFEGHPARVVGTAYPRPASPTFIPGGQCHLVFTGLDATGHDLRDLTATAHFYVSSSPRIEKTASPIQAGAQSVAYASVFYPSMQEIWPEVFSANSIKAVEVDMVVEVQSRNGAFLYVGPTLKVTYQRV